MSLKRDQEWGCSLCSPLSGMCKSFVPKCPWLGKIKSCDSLAGWTLLKLFGLVVILSQFPLLHMSRNFPSFLLSCLNVLDTSILIVVVVRRMYTCVKIHRTVHTHICTCLHTHTLRLEGAPWWIKHPAPFVCLKESWVLSSFKKGDLICSLDRHIHHL